MHDSYYTDSRVQAENHPYTCEVEGRTVRVTFCGWIAEALGELGEDSAPVVPFTYEVCNLCDGTGSVVNPSIDCYGLTASDFEEDPGFSEEYMAGHYDISCPTCQGLRVVPRPEFSGPVQALIKEWEDDAREAAQQAAWGY